MGKSNIVLIGMPSSGKTTIGKPLSLALGMDFIDTDNIIIAKENKELKDIVNQDGLKKFLEIQEKSLLELHLTNYVISTGGSVIYNKTAMEHLKNNGMVFYLRLTLDEIKTGWVVRGDSQEMSGKPLQMYIRREHRFMRGLPI